MSKSTIMASKLEPIIFNGVTIPSNMYAALGVLPSAGLTQSALRSAYLKQAARFHPDKHPGPLKETAAIAFSRISLAFRTLSDPTTKETYDQDGEAAQPPHPTSQSAITSGDTVFSALELAKLYSDILPLMHALPRIEAENGCAPGTLTASAGPSTRCSGADCDLSFLHGLTHIQNKVLLCKKHRVAHQCDHHCTQPDRVCPIWAYWNINRYRHEVATSWTVQLSGDDDPVPKRPYWYNPRGGISAWKAGGVDGRAPTAPGETDAPPQGPVTPHVCNQARCRRSGFVQLDPGIWVCRASSTGHICTATQCMWHWRPPQVKRELDEAVPKEASSDGNAAMVCWATDRPVADTGENWGNVATDRPRGNNDSLGGVEKRVVTFNDQRTGQTVSSLVERPIGTEIGEAIDELPPGLQSQARSMQQLNYTETKAQAQIREAELKRLLKLQQGHNADAAFGGGAEAADPQSPGDGGGRSKQRPGKRKRGRWPQVMSPGEYGNTFGDHYGHDTSRLKRIRANVARTVSRLKHDEFSDHSDDDTLLEEEGTLYNTYNVLDAADYNQAEEIGDYNTQYTLAGGAEAILEEHEEMHDHEAEAQAEYLAYAQKQFLEASDPNAPVEWYGDPSIGTAHPNGGALRIYDGKTYIVRERPPVFKPPAAVNFARSERMQIDRRKQPPRVTGVRPRTRDRLKRFAHRLGPPGSTSPDMTAMSRETSPTPSGADRTDLSRSLSPDPHGSPISGGGPPAGPAEGSR